MIAAEDLLSFLKQHVQGDLKYHHEFRITIAECPNACSQPQIKDIGIIAALVPGLTNEVCTACEAVSRPARTTASSFTLPLKNPKLTCNAVCPVANAWCVSHPDD